MAVCGDALKIALILLIPNIFSHLDPPANGQAVIFLKGLLEVFYSELSNLATVSDNSVRYQAITVVKR